MFKKLIKKRIRKLELEKDAMYKNKLKSPPGSLRYERLNLAVKMWEFKIAIWRALAA